MFSRSAFSLSALVVVLGWIGVVSAAPVDAQKRAISATQLNNLAFFAQYSAAAYCAGNNNSTGTKVVCPEGNCAIVEQADTNTLSEFENSIATDVTGFVATDTTNRLIILSFRGSRSLRNWITNLNFPTAPTSICTTCDASNGFWDSWNEAKAKVLEAIDEALAQYPGYKVVATGHSLGGALASLGAGVLRGKGLEVDLYTYGSPRVGLAGIATELSKTDKGANFRVTHHNDPVPRLPPSALGYRHITPEYYVSSGNDVQPTAEDVTVYEGINTRQGVGGDIALDIMAHLNYFGEIAACEGETMIEVKRDKVAGEEWVREVEKR